MHIHNLDKWQHSHRFNADDSHGERNTKKVVILTLFMMVVEIYAGYVYGSMALLADGWHMGTHAAALGITLLAYYYARRHSNNPDYSFGTGKVGVLGGFTSAVVLAVIALLMGAESIKRLVNPLPIHFTEAIIVATFGLIVNVVSAFLLQGKPHQGHTSDTKIMNHDHNLRAAYFHVIADALTSVFAIIALGTGMIFGWVWMDPIMGMIGAVIITKWSYGLLVDTGKILLDRNVNQEAIDEITKKIESDSDNRVSDIHVWRVGPQHLSTIISIVTHFPKPPEYYKNLLDDYDEISHVTIEVNKFEGEPCLKPKSQ